MKTKYWIALLAAVFVLFGGVGLYLLAPGEISDRAQILSRGEVLYTVDLHIDQSFTVDTNDGGHNVVTVQGGKIAVTEANCPDHYCMNRGYCAGGADIVCLPNKLVIRFLGPQEVDGVVG